MEPDVVYPLKRQESYKELRYSLRSLSNIECGKVYIGGSCPDWAKNVEFIENYDISPDRFKDAFMNLYIVLQEKALSEDIVVMNDDIYIMKLLKSMSIPTYRGRELTGSTWRAFAPETIKIMKMLDCRSSFAYEQHAPFVCKKSRLKHILDKIIESTDDYGRIFWRSIYGNYYHLGGLLEPDVKVKGYMPTIDSMDFISSEDTTFEQWVLPTLQKHFPRESIYEKF